MDKLSRRNFIFGISKYGIATCTLDLFLEQIIYGKIQTLLASETVGNINYVGIYFSGGPPRWMFDCPLESDFISSLGVGTKLQRSDGQIIPSYELSSGLPPLWEKFGDLKNNTAIIRGVEALPIHPNNYLQFTPQTSMPGVHAFGSISNTSFPLPCVQWGVDFSLNHPDKKSSAVIYDGISNSIEATSDSAMEVMEKIINPFSSKNVRAINDELQKKIDNALSVFMKMGRAYNINSDLLHDEVKNAKDLIAKDLDAILASPDEFSASFDAYGSAIKKFRDTTITGIDELDGASITYDGSNEELWSGAGGYSPDTATPLSDYYQSAFNDTLQLSLAMAEFVIKNKLSNSLLLSAGHLEAVSSDGSKSTTNRLSNDAHSVGGVVSTVLFSKYFEGFGYGINEFIDRVKGEGDYLIHLGSEFSRSAQSSGAGSDHGADSAVHTLISNKIKSNQILGEVTADSKEGSSYYGSWGKAADTISLKQVHSSICDLMGLDTNTYSFYEDPLVTHSGGTGESKYPASKLSTAIDKWWKK